MSILFSKNFHENIYIVFYYDISGFIWQKFNIIPKTVTRNISNLKNKDLLRRVGSNKSGYWKVY